MSQQSEVNKAEVNPKPNDPKPPATEKSELGERIKKLESFITGDPAFKEYPAESKINVQDQLDAMKKHYDSLV